MKKVPVVTSFLGLCLVLPLFCHGADFHVSMSGVDSGTCGATSSPCKSISQAKTNAGAGTNIINIAKGSYHEDNSLINPLAGLTIKGGWNESFTSQDCSPTNTVLYPDTTIPLTVAAETGESISVDIQCLQISGQNTSINKGVHVHATGSNAHVILSMSNCKVDSFGRHGVHIVANTSGSIVVELTDSLIAENIQLSDTGHGGAGMAIYATSSGNVDIEMYRNRVINNTSLNSGGGLFFWTGSGGSLEAELENNIIAENQGSPGGGIYSNTYYDAGSSGDIDLILTNNTITKNQSAGVGGGFYLQSEANKISAKLRNNIVWGNIGVGDGDDIGMIMVPFTSDDGSGINVDYSIIGEVYINDGNYIEGSYNLNTNPSLNDDHLLRSGSVAINAGQCGYNYLAYTRIAPYDDIEGELRPGFGQISGCDIGADEFDSLLCFPVKNSEGIITTICF